MEGLSGRKRKESHLEKNRRRSHWGVFISNQISLWKLYFVRISIGRERGTILSIEKVEGMVKRHNGKFGSIHLIYQIPGIMIYEVAYLY